MEFWHAINDGPGYHTERLTGDELHTVLGLITSQYLEQLGRAAPELVAAATLAGIGRYHTLSVPFDHGTYWSKEKRVLNPSLASVFERMGFFRRIREHLPSATIFAADLMWRVVRPNQPGDVGPVHADKWFWDAGNGSIPDTADRFKIWIALVSEPGLNGLSIKPDSHTSDRWKHHFENRHGIVKPVLDEKIEDLGMELLPLGPGELVLFHDALLHGGVVNKGTECRVSLELTVIHPRAEGDRLTALVRQRAAAA